MKTCCTLARTAVEPAGEPLPTDEWASLMRRERVALRRGTAPVATGTVVLVADDGSIFWVLLDNAQGRVAVHVSDDAAVWRA